jgi:hypothetical protein
LRRLHWVPVEPKGDVGEEGFVLISPAEKMRSGFDAARVLMLLLPGPLLTFFIITRFGGFGDRILGIVTASDVIFLMFAGLLLLWVPGVSRFLGQPLFVRCSAWLSRLLPSDP